MPTPDAPPPPAADDGASAEGPGGAPPARRFGDVDEPRVPSGCHPLVFGVVMATIQFAVTIYFMQTC